MAGAGNFLKKLFTPAKEPDPKRLKRTDESVIDKTDTTPEVIRTNFMRVLVDFEDKTIKVNPLKRAWCGGSVGVFVIYGYDKDGDKDKYKDKIYEKIREYCKERVKNKAYPFNVSVFYKRYAKEGEINDDDMNPYNYELVWSKVIDFFDNIRNYSQNKRSPFDTSKEALKSHVSKEFADANRVAANIINMGLLPGNHVILFVKLDIKADSSSNQKNSAMINDRKKVLDSFQKTVDSWDTFKIWICFSTDDADFQRSEERDQSKQVDDDDKGRFNAYTAEGWENIGKIQEADGTLGHFVGSVHKQKKYIGKRYADVNAYDFLSLKLLNRPDGDVKLDMDYDMQWIKEKKDNIQYAKIIATYGMGNEKEHEKKTYEDVKNRVKNIIIRILIMDKAKDALFGVNLYFSDNLDTYFPIYTPAAFALINPKK